MPAAIAEQGEYSNYYEDEEKADYDCQASADATEIPASGLTACDSARDGADDAKYRAAKNKAVATSEAPNSTNDATDDDPDDAPEGGADASSGGCHKELRPL